jgi:hypothetical protein
MLIIQAQLNKQLQATNTAHQNARKPPCQHHSSFLSRSRSSPPSRPPKAQKRRPANKMAQQNGSAVAGKPHGGDTHGQALTGKQEHCNFPSLFICCSLGTSANETIDLKRELIAQQVKYEITELNSPTALQRFGAPFKSDFGEISPLDSELPILRYIFVHHVREFPFLDKAKEKEFWQEKLQVVCASYPENEVGRWNNC